MHSHSPSSSVRPSSPVAPSVGEQAEEFDAPIDGSNGRKEDDDCTTPFEPIVPGGPYVEDSWALVPYRPLHFVWDIGASADSPHHDQSAEIEVEDRKHNVGDTSRFGRVYHQSHHVISPYTDPCKKKVKFNLNRHIDASKERAFDEWYRVAPKEATVCTSYMTVGKEFFAELLTDEGWLNSDVSYMLYVHVKSLWSYVWNDVLFITSHLLLISFNVVLQHIDTILYFIQKRRFDNEKMFTNTCAILDVLFWVR